MAEFLEAVMLVCFGLSWPMNAYKAAKARTAAKAAAVEARGRDGCAGEHV